MKIKIEYQEMTRASKWKTAFWATVLYADRVAIFTRGAGGHQHFRGSGVVDSWGESPDHKDYCHDAFYRSRDIRMEPKSWKRLQQAIKDGKWRTK